MAVLHSSGKTAERPRMKPVLFFQVLFDSGSGPSLDIIQIGEKEKFRASHHFFWSIFSWLSYPCFKPSGSVSLFFLFCHWPRVPLRPGTSQGENVQFQLVMKPSVLDWSCKWVGFFRLFPNSENSPTWISRLLKTASAVYQHVRKNYNPSIRLQAVVVLLVPLITDMLFKSRPRND